MEAALAEDGSAFEGYCGSRRAWTSGYSRDFDELGEFSVSVVGRFGKDIRWPGSAVFSAKKREMFSYREGVGPGS